MIEGRFTDDKELLFDIELVAINGEKFPIEALLDTGFTDGWLAINTPRFGSFGMATINFTGSSSDSTGESKI
jgi:predicted aspartyl protease